MVSTYSRKQVFDRISVLAIVIFILSSSIVLRLFNLQIIQGSFYEALAAGNHTIYKELYPRRGEVFIKDSKNQKEADFYPVAINIDLNEIYAIPNLIKDYQKTAELLTSVLEAPREEIEMRLSKKDDPYEPLAHYVTDEKVEEIKALDLEGIGFKPEIKRFYPEENLFSHVLGFVGFSDDERVGQYGVEGFFEETLAGRKGGITLKKGVLGNWIATSRRTLQKAEDGAGLVLTLDRVIQFAACSELKIGIEKYGASAGSVIIMNPRTGAILALCAEPNFDPNNYSQVENINVYINQVISHAYEPGSIFKVITMAAGLDSGKVTPKTTYEDVGMLEIDDHKIRNSDLKAHGVVNMTTVLEESLNLGAVFVAQQVGQQNFKDYVEKFGFASSTGIELGSEGLGNISSLNKGGEIYLATASYGQGITVTAIQMITSFTPIVMNGNLVKPHIVASILKPDGEVIKTEPRLVPGVITPATAKMLSAMLVSVVRSGHAKKAGVPGYYVAGKTGTAQVAKGGGYSNLTIHSFVGFVPVDNPAFIALVKLDYPTNVLYAADSAAPIFGKIAKFVLDYYQIPPDY
ncbi:penicillin-binding protein 2 [Patescibacteria group bacterium]|nr:penicillin-binding protein 2 [Patescibacteria group bacterium]MBU4511905.1 penicillin-binding protein 2 [Patescibacteria group bacterium]MCG2692873.1 penicillin-binding protein 2 [Candidatus Parcubacteria bacterium]